MSEQLLAGRGWNFPVHFHPPGKGPVMVSGNDDIRQALEILISTTLGERAMRPDWGSPLPEFMFSLLDTDAVALLSEKLAETIQSQERRIELHSVDVDDSSGPDGLLLINISYSVRETNTRDNLVYPFYLLENSG